MLRSLGLGIAVTSPTTAFSASLTTDECKVVAAVAGKVVKAIGRDTLSLEFRQSFRNWLGAELTCDGPTDILTPTVNDVAAFNTIRTVLVAGDHPLSLQDAGLRAVVDPAKP
jgi:hypothetical protein